jgi:hypothetical protein
MCCSSSVFLFCFQFSFVLFALINGWIPAYLLWRETRSIFIASTAFSSCFPLVFCSELFGLVHLFMISSLVFIDYYLWELFQISWLVLDKSTIFHAYSGAKGRLLRLWLRLWHVMLDIILIICLVVIVVAWLVSNNWEVLMCHWKNHALFLSYKSIILWYSPLMFFLRWLMVRSRYPVGNPKRKVWWAQQQVSLSCETKVYWTSSRKPNFRRLMLASFTTLRTIALENTGA